MGKQWALGDAGERLIKHFESLELVAYPDPGTGGEPYTIGWGHTGGVKPGDTCTEEQAQAWFVEDTRFAVNVVNAEVGEREGLTQHMFDALVSFVYNCGAGNFRSSTLLKKLTAGDFGGAAEEFPRWVYANGKKLRGLERRRERERELFLTPADQEFSLE